MNLLNHEPTFKMFGNGFQITFPNKYTVIVKNGIGAKCTQNKQEDDPLAVIMSARFGGNTSPNVEVEIYDPNKENISERFGEKTSLGYCTTLELVDLLYIVSALKEIRKK